MQHFEGPVPTVVEGRRPWDPWVPVNPNIAPAYVYRPAPPRWNNPNDANYGGPGMFDFLPWEMNYQGRIGDVPGTL